MKKEIKELYEQLKKPFPKEAYQVDNSRGFALTSIKAQYVVERLNDVLGVEGWSVEGEFEETSEGVLFIGELSVRVEIGDTTERIKRSGVGYATIKKGHVGDAYKGAMTDLISKTSSHLGVGNEVFKGNVDVKSLGAGDYKAKESTSTLPKGNNTWRSAKSTPSTDKTESEGGFS